jgi:uncharacterized protein YbcV (DUF1398 family)
MASRLEAVDIDWGEFERYLADAGLSRRWVGDLLRYARRYYRLLWEDPRLWGLSFVG